MKRAAPKLRDFAERLISIGAIESEAATSKPPAVLTVLEQLRPCLAQIIGSLGFCAVLSRALTIASTEAAWLRAVRVEPDGSVEGLDDLEAKVDPKDIAAGRVVLLAEFVGLLVELIGERLVLQFVHQAMPNVPKADIFW